MEPRSTRSTATHAQSAALPADPQAAAPKPPLLLALAVHWDDCSVALGTREGFRMEVWSRQPERSSPAGTGAGIGSSLSAGPLASRDALLLLDRLLVRTGTSLSAVDRLCFARGPGAFTSLRVAAGLIQGLSLATSIPAVGICSLGAMAAQEPDWQPADSASPRTWLQLSAIDARMGECYFGLHECRSGHHPEPLIAAAVGLPAAAIDLFDAVLAQRAAHRTRTAGGGAALAGIALAGNAFRLLPELAAWAHEKGLDSERAASRSATAAAVLAVAASPGAPQGGPAQSALPVYVRDKIALDVTEQKAGAAARALAVLARRGA